LTRGQNVVLLIGVFLLGLAHASCARAQSHYQLPQLAAADPSFLLNPGGLHLGTRSFALNDEVNAVVYHNEVVGQLEKIFAEDLTYSRKVDFEQWRSRGPFRFAASSSIFR